jgi:hypothetical protein
MEDPLEFVPGYVSPLTDKEHARIGRIAILWGQIEHFVEHLVTKVSGLSWAELETIGVTNKPIAAKVDFLNVATGRLDDPDLRQRVKAFCAMIHETKLARNHVFHGIWGWRADQRTKSVFAAARKTSQPEAPFKASQLPGLEKKLCKCSRMGSDLMVHFWEEGFRVKLMRFIHHAGDEHPAWLDHWSKRNPMDDGALDHNAKAGQLPRLAAHYPRT